ncbi:MAG: TonB-dependent receptor domain-containing protein [Butyricimonas faecihominis]
MSNRFGQDTKHRFQPVWSLGLRWNVTDEHWLQGQDILSNLAITASLGYQGNVAEGVSPDLIARMEPIQKTTGEYQMKIVKRPTPDLKWEKTLSSNIGVDLSFFKNRINGVFNYYYKKTTDLITQREVPLENGVRSMYINSGDLTNKGWELSLSVVPVRTKNFMWSIGTSFSHNNNKIKSQLETTQSGRGNCGYISKRGLSGG